MQKIKSRYIYLKQSKLFCSELTDAEHNKKYRDYVKRKRAQIEEIKNSLNLTKLKKIIFDFFGKENVEYERSTQSESVYFNIEPHVTIRVSNHTRPAYCVNGTFYDHNYDLSLSKKELKNMSKPEIISQLKNINIEN